MDIPPPLEMTPAGQHAPVPKRRLRWLRRLGWTAVWLVTLYVLFIAVENWRGRRAWNSYVAEMGAIGESLETAAVIPPPIPDEENFFAAPLFHPLFDYERDKDGVRWRDSVAVEALDFMNPVRAGVNKTPLQHGWRRGLPTDMKAWQTHYRSLADFPKNAEPGDPAQDVLLALSRYDKQLAGLREAATRPKARAPLKYEENFGMLLPHLRSLIQLGWATQLRSLAELDRGAVDRAYEELRLTLRIAESIETEPTMIAQQIRFAVLDIAMQPLWEGIVRHQWSEAHLAELQEQLSRYNFAASYQLALRGERQLVVFPGLDAIRSKPEYLEMLSKSTDAAGNPFKAPLLTLAPQGWFSEAKVSAGRLLQEMIASVSANPIRFSPERGQELERTAGSPLSPLGRIADIGYPSLRPAATSPEQERAARVQATMDLAVISIMLERHWRRHGSYPEALTQLDPDLTDEGRGIRQDCVTGGAPRYERRPDGRYILYYVGWNERDDGGQIEERATGNGPKGASEGDWVWPQLTHVPLGLYYPRSPASERNWVWPRLAQP